ncbi:DUF808 domain-containing protein [Tenacibaculum larymnensis]|uniref:DUF808 domain-containing protein n=1 Tax=Tenacibaculum larymnensis TaxID=2878201 RepID=A0A9X4EP56_9FLAO|nr:DUF808 domain-containing protein [Tenacibaculum larymnensis]MDE1207651.1 DUF808 domain-containing protein [Tenacibaculum larymnensis]
MASGFFAILDDISALMDDVASMSKIATKKTAGILGDDLAVNAQKATGFLANRELPVLLAITKGSFLNKLIILPIAFLLSAYLPAAITVILILGGIYLAYEGVEKIYEYIFPHHDTQHEKLITSVSEAELPQLEKQRVKQAVLTDFILSIEIVIIALGTVIKEPLIDRILVVTIVAIIATIGVYGIVALIVRMDDFGYKLIWLNDHEHSFSDKIGRFLVQALPIVIKILSVVGTLALLLVSGGIFSHNIEYFHHLFPGTPQVIKDFIFGIVVGFIALILMMLFKKIFLKK